MSRHTAAASQGVKSMLSQFKNGKRKPYPIKLMCEN